MDISPRRPSPTLSRSLGLLSRLSASVLPGFCLHLVLAQGGEQRGVEPGGRKAKGKRIFTIAVSFVSSQPARHSPTVWKTSQAGHYLRAPMHPVP